MIVMWGGGAEVRNRRKRLESDLKKIVAGHEIILTIEKILFQFDVYNAPWKWQSKYALEKNKTNQYICIIAFTFSHAIYICY